MDHSSETIIPSNARSVSHKSLPPCPPQHLHGDNNTTCQGSILLFYQYIEPQWSKKQHKSALKKVIEIGQRYNITGRGRVAAEGLNCTLTSSNPTDIRSFCYALRDWDDVFHDTDFKITDGIGRDKLFKSLSIRKTEELVAYGLGSGEFCYNMYVLWDLKIIIYIMEWRNKSLQLQQPLSRMLNLRCNEGQWERPESNAFPAGYTVAFDQHSSFIWPYYDDMILKMFCICLVSIIEFISFTALTHVLHIHIIFFFSITQTKHHP